MDQQPDILSSEPARPRHPARIVAALVVVACLVAIAGLAVAVMHRDTTITSLRGQLRQAQRPAAPPAQPTSSGSALFALPSGRLGSYSLVAVGVHTRSDSAALTWIFIYGQHAQPGQRYGLLQGRCGGQFVTPSDLADGTADRHGDLMIAVADPDVSTAESDVYFQLYRLEDGTPLGGVRGPLVGGGAQTFVSKPSCPSLFSATRVEEGASAQPLQEDA
jgi:hypothetical protein